MGDSLLNQLKKIVNSIDDGGLKSCGPCGGPCGPCCGPTLTSKPLCSPPCPFPYLQVCMLTPPPCPAPTEPKYVKPLTLPCPPGLGNECKHDPETDFKTRFANFYNNYNVDYHSQGINSCSSPRRSSGFGVTVDGQSPRCVDYRKRSNDDCLNGCPTGFKPCTMKLCPPPCCNPLDPWRAQVQPCPAKPRKKATSCGTCA
ncbi:hypothetical protein ILUMI_04882 [Ignelater luminosus]|uniref:Uncharacterized protein n=1 Tax=Ignelater luminosus TaxID=2038154 RepID=A0A8K0GIM5_IGNLU|nr:hypothetical protein ILUMI_04882 [Ignelater luminosus]